MSVNSEIRNGLIALIKQVSGGMDSFTAEVRSVDIPSRTCTVLSISTKVETEYPGVWLMPEINDGLLYTPTIGSTVVVANNVNMQPYIAMWSAIDKVLYVSGGSTFQIDKNGVQLDGNNFDGLMKIVPSLKAINDLQNDINNLKTLFSALISLAPATVTSAVGTPDAFAALFASNMATYAGQSLTPTQKSDIENTKVRHGGG